jgi:putative membrane protein
MRIALPTIAAVVTLFLTAPAPARAQTPTPYPGGAAEPRPPVGQGDAEHRAAGDADADFMKKAANDGQAEIELADVALKQGHSADVKTFATKIKADHMAAATELKRLASTKHVALPSKLMADEAVTKERLTKLSGSAFDRAYAGEMVTDHQKAVELFTTASQSSDSEVKAFATKTLPVLQAHLQHAQELRQSVGGGKNQP